MRKTQSFSELEFTKSASGQAENAGKMACKNIIAASAATIACLIFEAGLPASQSTAPGNRAHLLYHEIRICFQSVHHHPKTSNTCADGYKHLIPQVQRYGHRIFFPNEYLPTNQDGQIKKRYHSCFKPFCRYQYPH